MFMKGVVVPSSNLLELLASLSVLSSSNMHTSIHHTIDYCCCCSISRNKLFIRKQHTIAIAINDITSCAAYITNHNHTTSDDDDVNRGTVYLYQEEKNKDSRFCSRVCSTVDGNIDMILSKLSFEEEKNDDGRFSVVLRIETAEKVIVNLMKVYNKDGSFTMRIELIRAVVDGINGQESLEKLKHFVTLLGDWIKLDA